MVYEIYNNEKGQRHRIGGPAYIDNKVQIWYMNGLWHRIDGPAYIKGRHESWYINHKKIMYSEDYIHEGIKDYIHYET